VSKSKTIANPQLRRRLGRHFARTAPGEGTRNARSIIYNPDGSEAEKSGNGLRIFSRYLWDRKIVSGEEFRHPDGGWPRALNVFDGGKSVRVEMGRVSFWSDQDSCDRPAPRSAQRKISVADASSPTAPRRLAIRTGVAGGA